MSTERYSNLLDFFPNESSLEFVELVVGRLTDYLTIKLPQLIVVLPQSCSLCQALSALQVCLPAKMLPVHNYINMLLIFLEELNIIRLENFTGGLIKINL